MEEGYDDRTSVETRTLLDFVSSTPADEVPAEVLHESMRCLIDHLGLAIAGAAEPAAASPGHSAFCSAESPRPWRSARSTA